MKHRVSALPPNGLHPPTHFFADRPSCKRSKPTTTRKRMALPRKKVTTAVRENALPISTEEMVETATDNGTLQKSRSIRERLRKSWRFVNHAARYPLHTVAGRNAGTARRLSTACANEMDVRSRMQPP